MRCRAANAASAARTASANTGRYRAQVMRVGGEAGDYGHGVVERLLAARRGAQVERDPHRGDADPGDGEHALGDALAHLVGKLCRVVDVDPADV